MPQDMAGVGVAGVGDVVVEMHDAFGPAGGAGAVEPEGHVVAVRIRGRHIAAVRGQQLAQGMRPRRPAARHDQRDRLGMPVERLGQLVQVRALRHHDAGAGCLPGSSDSRRPCTAG